MTAVGFFGSVGGAGVSSFIAALAEELPGKVLVLDARTDSPSLDGYLGLAGQTVYTLTDAVNGTVPPEKAFLTVSGGLSLLPSLPFDELSFPLLAEKTEELGRGYGADFLLLDLPLAAAKDLLPVLDAAVNVTTFAEHARRNGEAFSFLMSKSKPKKEYLLFNRIDLSGETMGKLPSLLDTVEQIGQPLLGVVPEDEAAVRRHTKEYGKSDYRKAVSHIAGRLTGKNVPLCSGFRREGFRRRLFLDK